MILIGLVLFLSLSLFNTGLVILSLGQIVVVPVLTILLHMVTGIMSAAKIPSSEISMLVPSIESAYQSNTVNVVPSYWAAHIVFFCFYIFSNALSTYKMDASSSTASREYDWRLEHRKARSTMIMAVSLLIMVLLLLLRFLMTNAETVPGILVALIAFAPAGYWWYEVAKRTGARNSDILGIVEQMIPLQDDKEASMCVPSGATSTSSKTPAA
jgi:hypothetical protein